MRILLIDDDPEELELFEYACKDLSEPLHFVQAADCTDALELITEDQPRLIIIDIHLARHSGIDCLKQLRLERCSSHLPIIMYSSSGSKQHIDSSFHEKANYFFVKPGSINDISTIINKLIATDWSKPQFPNRDAFVLTPV